MKKYGGETYKHSEVVGFTYEDGKLVSAKTKNGNEYFGDLFISNIEPKTTLKLIGKDKFRKAYYDRIQSLEAIIAPFSIYIVLKPECLNYRNYNNYHVKDTTRIWKAAEYTQESWPECYMISMNVSEENQVWEAPARIFKCVSCCTGTCCSCTCFPMFRLPHCSVWAVDNAVEEALWRLPVHCAQDCMCDLNASDDDSDVIVVPLASGVVGSLVEPPSAPRARWCDLTDSDDVPVMSVGPAEQHVDLAEPVSFNDLLDGLHLGDGDDDLVLDILDYSEAYEHTLEVEWLGCARERFLAFLQHRLPDQVRVVPDHPRRLLTLCEALRRRCW